LGRYRCDKLVVTTVYNEEGNSDNVIQRRRAAVTMIYNGSVGRNALRKEYVSGYGLFALKLSFLLQD